MSFEREINHPSFALMGFTRQTSNKGAALFGSSLKHENTITMKIVPAKWIRENGSDWYFRSGGKSLIEVEMSQAQFAQIITSANIGDGQPVTVRSYNGKKIDLPSIENKRRMIEDDFQKVTDGLVEKYEKMMEEALDILDNKKTISKSDREKIRKGYELVAREIGSNIPFMTTLFNEEMDKVVSEAKMEVESFIQTRMKDVSLGLSNSSEFPSLRLNGENEEE
jgi:hypothetical protein